MNRRLAIWFLVLCVLGAVALAAADDAPTLSTEQRLIAQNLILLWQVKQLQAQAAARDAEDAKAAVVRFATTLQKDGYTLDLQTLTYAAVPTEPAGQPGTTAEPSGGRRDR